VKKHGIPLDDFEQKIVDNKFIAWQFLAIYSGII